jgi:para-aminobenzoate synthetase component 1
VGSMEPGFYRGGMWARDLIEISEDPASLSDGNFWAVISTYEGAHTFARFADVRHDQEEAFLAHVREQMQIWSPPEDEWISSLSQSQYLDAVQEVREAIARGEVYQINLCRVLSTKSVNSNLLPIFPKLLSGNPAPFLTSIELPKLSISSASPELLLRREGNLITSSPIKGTAKRRDGFLEKDHAENVMIVDLVRHDFGSICKTGSIHTPRLLAVEEHPGLVHLVSDVQGELKADISWAEIFDSLLPAGSISGAPKSSARQLISRLEVARRGPYCGAIGWVQGDRAELAVGIRTFWIEHERDGALLKFGTGAGITWGSEPELEWAETELKASRLLSIIREREIQR